MSSDLKTMARAGSARWEGWTPPAPLVGEVPLNGAALLSPSGNPKKPMSETTLSALNHAMVRKHRHKWFAHTDSRAENGWSGPHDHIEDAARAALLEWEAEGDTCYIAQGRKLTKAECEEQGAEYTWEVDTLNAMKLVLPNDESSDRESGTRSGQDVAD